MNDLLNPVEINLLLRLIEKLEKLVALPWSRFDVTPTEKLKDFILLKLDFKVQDGFSIKSRMKRNLGIEIIDFEDDFKLKVSRVKDDIAIFHCPF